MNEPNTIIVWSPVGWAESEILTRSSRKGHQSIIEIVDSRLLKLTYLAFAKT